MGKGFGGLESMGGSRTQAVPMFEKGSCRKTTKFAVSIPLESLCIPLSAVRVAHFQFMPQRHRISVCGLKSLARQLCASVRKRHERHRNKWFFNLMCLLFEIWESFSSLLSGELFSFFSETKWIKSYNKYWRLRIHKIVRKVFLWLYKSYCPFERFCSNDLK